MEATIISICARIANIRNMANDDMPGRQYELLDQARHPLHTIEKTLGVSHYSFSLRAKLIRQQVEILQQLIQQYS